MASTTPGSGMPEHVEWEERYRRLIEEAPYIPGDEGESIEAGQIPWADPKLIAEGQAFCERHLIGLSLSHSGALILGFSIKNLSTVLLRTGGFNGVQQSLDRIFDTEEHIISWYTSDVVQQIGTGYKNVQIVRRLHRLALKKCIETHYEPDPSIVPMDKMEQKITFLEAMKKDLECVDTSEAPMHLLTYNPRVLINQFDMALTQYGFFAPIYVSPKTFGINDPKGLEAFVHLWAVIGRLLGVRDRYNLALHPNKELFVKIHDEIGMASLKEADLVVAGLQFAYEEALQKVMPGFSLPGFQYFGFSSRAAMPNYEGKHVYSLMTMRDKIFVFWLRFIFFLMFHFDFIRAYFHNQFRKISLKNREARQKRRKTRAPPTISATPATIPDSKYSTPVAKLVSKFIERVYG